MYTFLNICNVSWTWNFIIGKLLLPCFTDNNLVEEEREHQVEVQTVSQSVLQDPAISELSKGEAREDMCPGVTPTLQKQQEQQPIPQESQEADPEGNEVESEGKQEMEDQVETFFSSMSNRYEEPLVL